MTSVERLVGAALSRAASSGGVGAVDCRNMTLLERSLVVVSLARMGASNLEHRVGADGASEVAFALPR